MSAESSDRRTTPLDRSDRLFLLVAAAIIAGFSIAVLHEAWHGLATGDVGCPYLQLKSLLLQQIHTWTHVIGNSLLGGLLFIVAVALALRTAAPVRLGRMTQYLLSGRFLALTVGVLLTFWGCGVAEIGYQAFCSGRSNFLLFGDPDTALTRVRFYAHAIETGSIAVGFLLSGLVLLIRTFLPKRYSSIVFCLRGPLVVVLLLVALSWALGVVGFLLGKVL